MCPTREAATDFTACGSQQPPTPDASPPLPRRMIRLTCSRPLLAKLEKYIDRIATFVDDHIEGLV
jgi:hypothetical protein